MVLWCLIIISSVFSTSEGFIVKSSRGRSTYTSSYDSGMPYPRRLAMADSVSDHVDTPMNIHNNHNTRRGFLTSSQALFSTLMITTTTLPQASYAGELGAKITAAVTQSDIGVSVRRSVVRGAQLIDKLDGKWEKFSDDNGLGTERSKQAGRPKPKVIPDALELNDRVAKMMIQAADRTFVALMTSTDATTLQNKITQVDRLVRKSFERSGLTLQGDESSGQWTSSQYNYLSYIHFRAYNELLVENKVNFKVFRRQFETKLGDELVHILLANEDGISKSFPPSRDALSFETRLQSCFVIMDRLLQQLRQYGLVALADRSVLEEDTIHDWAQNLSDLQFTVSLDKDATLNAQILLQEQGYRLYPDLGRFAVASVLTKELGQTQDVTSEEYYMDTDYNSDPDKYEVKEVLLNIVIESK